MESLACLMATVGPHTFAIPLEWVRTIVPSPPPLPMPGTPPHVRGTVELLERWLAQIDLRCVLGLQSLPAQQAALAEDFADHEAQHAMLTAGDATPCRFQAWLDTVPSATPSQALMLRQLADQHEALHRSLAAGDASPLPAFLEQLRSARIRLEEDVREVTISIEPNGHPLAITVDTVHRVEEVTVLEPVMGNRLVRYGEGQTGVLLDLELLLGKRAWTATVAAAAQSAPAEAPGAPGAPARPEPATA